MAAKSIETINKGWGCLGQYELFLRGSGFPAAFFPVPRTGGDGQRECGSGGAEAVAATSAGDSAAGTGEGIRPLADNGVSATTTFGPLTGKIRQTGIRPPGAIRRFGNGEASAPQGNQRWV
jgi:hypothetical protein